MKFPVQDKKFTFLLVAVVVAVGLEICSIMGLELPMPHALFIYMAFVIIVGHHVLWEGFKSLFRGNIGDINLLMFIAVISAFYLGEYPEAAVLIVLYVLGEKLEDIGLENSKSALDVLVNNIPKSAIVKETGDNIPIDQIQVGTVIQIKPHDQIPLDGVIQKGETLVDESPITGEPVPKDKEVGDTVYAGTMNKNGFIEVKTTKTAKDTTFAKIIELTYESQNNKSETQKFIQKFAKIYTPIVIVLAVLLFVIPVFFLGKDLEHWLKQAVTMLVISCPCALVISTPVAIYAAVGNAFSKGALVKGGKYLEALADVRAVALDKTRTITMGKPVVSDVIPFNNADEEELLACSAGTEMFSEHPLAQAIVERAKADGFEPHAVHSFESVVGKGAQSKCIICNDKSVLVGKVEFIKQYHILSREIEIVVERLSSEGKTSVVVCCDNEIKGIIGLTDEVKEDSFNAIQEMQKQGVEIVMLTGDNCQAARFVAKSVGIQNVYGELLPQDKTEKVKELLSQYENVAMVGDGVNDAPALAISTVGIAMGAAGSDTAIEIANIALMNDKLSLIPFLIRLGRKTVSTIKWNSMGAILVKLIFILLAFMGFGNLVLAIAADVGVTLIVILISLRLMNTK